MIVLSEREQECLIWLHTLRYLTADQIRRGWFEGRRVEAVARRFRDLRAAGWLTSMQVEPGQANSVWRLTRAGLHELHDFYMEPLAWYRDISAAFIPHLLDTNEVFLQLGGPQTRLNWTGSHLAAFSYRKKRGARGVIRPDALVRTRSFNIFIELDRSTECLRRQDFGRTIENKLRAYRALFLIDGKATARLDHRRNRLVFVLSKNDKFARDENKRHRRLRGILDLANKIDTRMDVHCVYLSGAAALRAACGIGGDSAPPIVPSDKANVPTQTIMRVSGFYSDVVEHIRACPTAENLIESANAAYLALTEMQQAAETSK